MLIQNVTGFICLNALAFVPADPVQFDRIDVNHSTIGFSVSIMEGMSRVTGKFSDFDVKISYDREKAENSSITATIKTASIVSGNSDRDNHMKSGDFFAADSFPQATFVSKKFRKKESGLLVTGDFTLRGVTREVTFPLKITGFREVESSERPGEMRAIMGVSARFTINRRDFGIVWQHDSVSNFVSDEVTIEIDLKTRSVKL